MDTFPAGGLAAVIGSTGAIGKALADRLEAAGRFSRVIRLSRRSAPGIDLTDEASIAAAAAWLAGAGLPLRLVIDATGFLHDDRFMPEKALRQVDPAHMAHAFAVNAIGPGLLMKHMLPLLPRDGKSAFATLSARVGSISDNRLGGWHAYRASKAALNQFVRTASIELARRNPHAICVALHPGTVDSLLSQPFAKAGLDVRPPAVAAKDLLSVLDALTPEQSGGLYDHRGAAIPW
ncbi:C-factor [Zhengella mangrovi]|uniref:C-factor n=1 Tax=Zhengella mangrovi TaxID=1982044 RepID=A0A2G1QN35_9HYPH|nr:SDR family NAD(P)-dependent oxidoreductase [Zhengella mangrovi]PHP66860.1 C-factor [Zhengella mangrovi]